MRSNHCWYRWFARGDYGTLGATRPSAEREPLRLVSVIKPTHPSPDDYDRDLAHAERSLREAHPYC